MANQYRDWDDLGKSIQDIVDKAVNSKDYQKLNQTVCQMVGKAVDMGSEAVRKAMDASARPAASPGKTGSREAKTVIIEEKRDLPVLYAGTGSETAVGLIKIVGGGLSACIGFVALVSLLVLLIAGAGLTAAPTAVMAGGFGAGVWLIASGIRTLSRVGRFKTYRKTLGQSTHCSLEQLARSVGKSVKFVRRELHRMIDKGLFLEGHMDKEETCLITSNETYRSYEQSRRALEERRQQEAAEAARAAALGPQVQEVLDRGNAFIDQIRACNDAIPGEEISEKISRIELIVRRIFQRAEAHPEVVPDLKKLMDYYLPMTVKLLNAYADMDAQPVQGENIQNSKKEIEATLDTLNLAFEKLLDDLFRDSAMDVSSDISVLNTLLAQEGLTQDDFPGMKKHDIIETGE